MAPTALFATMPVMGGAFRVCRTSPPSMVMMIWAVAMVASGLWIVDLGLGGSITLYGGLLLGGVFLWKAFMGIRTGGGAIWARDLFFFSLVYLSGMFVLMAADHILTGTSG